MGADSAVFSEENRSESNARPMTDDARRHSRVPCALRRPLERSWRLWEPRAQSSSGEAAQARCGAVGARLPDVSLASKIADAAHRPQMIHRVRRDPWIVASAVSPRATGGPARAGCSTEASDAPDGRGKRHRSNRAPRAATPCEWSAHSPTGANVPSRADIRTKTRRKSRSPGQ